VGDAANLVPAALAILPSPLTLMLDSRYFFIFLCVTFLMLGFGIVIGQSVTLPAQITRQQHTLQLLQAQVDGAVQEGRVAKVHLAQVENAMNKIRPRLVRNALAGQSVDVIQCSDYPQATSDAKAALMDAGANVTAVIVISDQFVDLSPERRDNIRQQLDTITGAAAQPSPETTVSLITRLAGAIAHGAPEGSPTASVLKMLEKNDLVIINGNVTQACSSFVLVGGRNDDGYPDQSDTSELEGELIEQLASAANGSSTVVGCEPLDVTTSSIPQYQKENIATVDCIDHPIGQIALPFAVRGEHDDFGLKSTARVTLPESLEHEATP